MPSYKLTFFDTRTRAEPIRWMFAVAKQPYEDIRIKLDQWGAIKADYLFGQLPELEVDGKKIYQSQAIMNYLGREFGLAGKTPLEQAHVIMIAEAYDDGLIKYIERLSVTLDPKKQEEAFKKYVNETLPFYLSKFEQLISVNNNGGDGYIVGKELTYADLTVVFFCDELEHAFGFKANLDKYPKLAALVDRVEANEGLAAWLAERPPLTGASALEMVTAYRRQLYEAEVAAAAAASK